MGFAQSLHLSQETLFVGDTLYGVAYFANAKLLNQTYEVSLRDAEGNLLGDPMLVLARDARPSFALVVPSAVASGQYGIQLTHYASGYVSHQRAVFLINPEDISAWMNRRPATALYALPDTTARIKLVARDTHIHLSFSPPEPSRIANVSVSVTDQAQHSLQARPLLGTLAAPTHFYQHLSAHEDMAGTQQGFDLVGELSVPNAKAVLVIAAGNQGQIYEITADAAGAFVCQNVSYTDSARVYVRARGARVRSLSVRRVSPVRQATPAAAGFLPALDSAQLAEMLRLRALRGRVQESYASLTTAALPAPWELSAPTPLFGYRDELFDLKDYVNFSSTKQAIKEVVSGVIFSRGRLRVIASDVKKTLPFDPLLLINGIPATEEEVLALPVQELRYVEVISRISKLRVLGEVAFGGVVNFITASYRPANEETLVMTLPGWTASRGGLELRTSKAGEPYFPACLYWMPSLQPESTGDYRWAFKPTDYSTSVQIRLALQRKDGSVWYHDQILPIDDK
ncbi:MAG: hypothetical protein ACFCUI_12105 [Bernardetiaceae bacterium]